MIISRCELEEPAEVSGNRLQGHDTRGIEVVASSRTALISRCRVAHAPEEEIQRRVVCSRGPGGCPTGLPRVTSPCIVSRLSRTGNGVELPQQPTVARVVRRDEAPDAELSAPDPDNDAVPQRERRSRHRITVAKISNFDPPLLSSRRRIQGDKMSIQRRHEHRVVQDRNPAIHRSTAQSKSAGHGSREFPCLLSRGRVECDNTIG